MLRICVETAGASHDFDNQPAEAAIECVSMFALKSGDGLRFLTPSGPCFWGWNDIQGVRVVRMPDTAANTEGEH